MCSAYEKRQDETLWPFRRLEATLWNVQIAKSENGKQFEPSQLYQLGTDPPEARKPKKAGGLVITPRLSPDQYRELMVKRFPATVAKQP